MKCNLTGNNSISPLTYILHYKISAIWVVGCKILSWGEADYIRKKGQKGECAQSSRRLTTVHKEIVEK